jgi:hypothetical protein
MIVYGGIGGLSQEFSSVLFLCTTHASTCDVTIYAAIVFWILASIYASIYASICEAIYASISWRILLRVCDRLDLHCVGVSFIIEKYLKVNNIKEKCKNQKLIQQ